MIRCGKLTISLWDEEAATIIYLESHGYIFDSMVGNSYQTGPGAGDPALMALLRWIDQERPHVLDAYLASREGPS